MPYQILDHTSELQIKVSAKNPKALFQEALKAMNKIIKKNSLSLTNKPSIIIINIKSLDQSSLLIDFLNQILALSHINHELYSKVVFQKFSATAIKAQLYGIKSDTFNEDIKAVTYHQTEIKKIRANQYETIVIFDI